MPLVRASVGIASFVAAGAAGFGAQAQEQPAAQGQTELPPLEVTTQKSPAKKAKPKKKASTSAVSPAPQGPSAAAEAPPPQTDSEQLGLTPPSGNTLQSGTGLGRLPGTLQDTPQTVNVVPQQQIQEQKISTLDQALRNVPGVTVAIGEGGGGMNGDQFRIRGFQAKGDIYVDGLRDFGVYVRDAFAYEQVEVIKGPSSESFGMGTTGGAINIQQKTAHRGDSGEIVGTFGTGPYYRTTIDINKQINETTAARAVGMWHNQDIEDRDHIYSDRWGFLGSLAFGLGTDTQLTVNYLHQSGDRLPDFGVPIVDQDGTGGPILGKPVTEYGVPRTNFYGKITDKDETTVDMLTARLQAKVNDSITVYNDTRLAFYSRDFAQTVPSCSGACLTSVVDGTFTGAYSLGGPAGFDQDSWGAQNITTLSAKGRLGGFRHEFVAGVDLFYQNDERTQKGVYDLNGVLQAGTGSAVKVPGTIGSPNFWNTTGYYVANNPLALKEASAYDVGLFASERLWLTKEFSVLGGVRWDSYHAEYRATDAQTGLWTGGSAANPPTYTSATNSADIETNSQFWSPKLSVIWEPSKNETYYASWARSYTPVGMFITNDNNSISTTSGQSGQDPEENELWEFGGKWTTLDGKLGLTAALFRVEKGNATFTDPTTGDTALSGEKQRVQGLELGLTGKVTDAWTVQMAYAYFDSEILYNPKTTGNNPVAENANKGHKVSFVPQQSFSVWSTYEVSKLVNVGPGVMLVGGGITITDEYYVNSGNTSYIPANFTLDGLVSYQLNDWTVAVNGYNLTDELNYDAGFGSRAVVSAGRTVLFTVGKKF
ncbi:MAG: TonB-dependent receptor [Hyphomicrobium sp.]|jgi:catecholate siderophore receptor